MTKLREDPEDCCLKSVQKVSDARFPREQHLSLRLHSPGLIESDVMLLNIEVKMIVAICYFCVSPKGKGEECGAGGRFNARL